MNDQIQNNVFYSKRKINIFFHICCLNNYIDVTNEIIDKIIESGLYDKSEKIFYCILGEANDLLIERIKSLGKFELIYNSNNISDVEYPTLINLYDFCSKNDSYVLYIHTKGVSLPYDKFRQLWRKRLLQKVVQEYNICISHLNDGYDVSGCGWKEVSKGKPVNYCAGEYPHYSGNFWWANSDYIKKLPDISKIRDKYLSLYLPKPMSDREKYLYQYRQTHDMPKQGGSISFLQYRIMCEFWIGMIDDVKAGINGELNKEYSNNNFFQEDESCK